jgi:hypothetical protein
MLVIEVVIARVFAVWRPRAKQKKPWHASVGIPTEACQGSADAVLPGYAKLSSSARWTAACRFFTPSLL